MTAEAQTLKQVDHNSAESTQARRPDSGQEKPPVQTPDDQRKRTRMLASFMVVLVIAAIGGVLYWLHARHYEDTDDAEIDGNLSPIGTRVDGTVVKVYVQNNQMVKVGDPLVDLDPRDIQVKLDQARAQLAQAQGQLAGERPNVPITEVENSTEILSAAADVASDEAAVAAAERDKDQAEAQVVQQEAANARAQSDLGRYTILAAKEEISKSDFDQYDSNAKQQAANLQAVQAALLAAARTVDQRKAQLEHAKSQLDQNEKNAAPQLSIRHASVDQQIANLKTAEAQLEQAQLNLSYARIVAPVAGIVMKRFAQLGSRVATGQQLLTISEIGDLWVTANFKETQLLHMRSGQHATIHVDSLDRDFTGSVDTIGGATGSIASTLPAENATGNYVKVVQRIPVRIKLDPNQDGLDMLRPGMSVEPNVQVE
ncbi:MAG TPA: HlyD family secretion protein [Terracidiphilus sp.]|jgi:membrane fusion protein, multidrug efflux system